MAWTTLCDYSELTEGSGKYVEIDGFRLAVFLREGKPYVLDNECPHAGGNMSQGWIDDDACAVCPWHGWGFHLDSGKLKGGQAVGLTPYPVRIADYESRKLVQADLPMA